MKLRDICQPFDIWLLCVEISFEDLMKTEAGKKQLAQTWAWKILQEISIAEWEDSGLKHLSGEERVSGRIEKVKPHLYLAWQYVREYEEAYQISVKNPSGDPSKRVTINSTIH